MENNKGIPVPLNEKQARLMAALANELTQRSVNITPGSIMYFAGFLAERVVKEGWQWHPSVTDPTPDQEIDMVDRIISGLPIDQTPFIVEEYMEEQGKKLPPIMDEWRRIPEFDNYEMNRLKVVRSRWTKRVLDVHMVFTQNGATDFVEMHDKEGFEHQIVIDFVFERTFV